MLSRLVSQAASALHALSTTHAAWLFLCNASELAECVNARSMYCLILGFLIVIVGLFLKYPLVFLLIIITGVSFKKIARQA